MKTVGNLKNKKHKLCQKRGKIQVRGCRFNDFKSIDNFSPSGRPAEKEYRLQFLGLRDNFFLVSFCIIKVNIQVFKQSVFSSVFAKLNLFKT